MGFKNLKEYFEEQLRIGIEISLYYNLDEQITGNVVSVGDDFVEIKAYNGTHYHPFSSFRWAGRKLSAFS